MTSVALIGPGRHGTAIARLLAAHGVDVVLQHHRAAKAERAAAAVAQVARGARVSVAPAARDAVADQELVLLTTLWDAPQRAVIGELGDELASRVLLDVSNPLDVTPSGIVLRTPPEGSAGLFVAGLLPEGAGHVKVFSNLPTAAIEAGADLTPQAVLPFAADSAASAARVRPMLERTGWLPWLVGDLRLARELEIGGRFNQVQGRWGRALPDRDQMLALAGPEARLN